MMHLLVGLGNPGSKYAHNRHNIGFMAADEIHRRHGFSPWRSKFQGEISQGNLGGVKTLLLKPSTFMNLSGQSVGEAMRFYKLSVDDVTVMHDELELAPSKLRIKTGGGHSGHNGLKSCDQHLGKEYHRVRMGIGHPGSKERVNPHVLGDFAKADQGWLQDVLDATADNADMLVAGKWSEFMNKVALKVQGEAPAPKKPKKAKPTDQNKDSCSSARKEEEPKNALADGLKKLFGMNSKS